MQSRVSAKEKCPLTFLWEFLSNLSSLWRCLLVFLMSLGASLRQMRRKKREKTQETEGEREREKRNKARERHKEKKEREDKRERSASEKEARS